MCVERLIFFGWDKLIFGNYLKLFIDELFAWPSTALKQTKNERKQEINQ